MVWVVKKTIQTVKLGPQAPKIVGNYFPSNKLLFMITGRVCSSFEIKSFSNCGVSSSLTFV